GARAAQAERLLRLHRLRGLRRRDGHEHRDPHASPRRGRHPRLGGRRRGCGFRGGRGVSGEPRQGGRAARGPRGGGCPMRLIVNIDVPELRPAIDFYCAALELKLERILDDDTAELTGGSSVVYLLRKPESSVA